MYNYGSKWVYHKIGNQPNPQPKKIVVLSRQTWQVHWKQGTSFVFGCFWTQKWWKMMETYMETINQLSQFNPIVKSRLLISDFVDTSRSWLFDVICSATFTKQSPFLLTKKMMSTLKQFLRPDHDGTVRQVCSDEMGYHCDWSFATVYYPKRMGSAK